MRISRYLLVLLISSLIVVSLFNGVSANDAEFVISREFGVQGTENGEFSTLNDLVKADEKYFISDYSNDRIQVFDTNFNFIESFGGTGAGLGQLEGPYSIDTNNTHIFVAETVNDRISIFDTDGNFITTFGSFGTGLGELDAPTEVKIDDGVIYVTDRNNQRIAKFNETNLDFIHNLSPIEISDAYGIAVDQDIVYLADSVTNSILLINKNTGDYSGEIGDPSGEIGYMANPYDVHVIGNYLLISDTVAGTLKIYDKTGNFVKLITAGLYRSFDMLIDGNSLLVAEGQNERLSILRIVANPSNIVANTVNNGVHLTWEINEAEGIVEPMGYTIYRDDGEGSVYLTEVTSKSFFDETALSNTTVSYYVQSNSILGSSDLINSNSVSVEDNSQGTVTVTETISEEEGGTFDNLSFNILPIVIVLIMIPLLKERTR